MLCFALWTKKALKSFLCVVSIFGFTGIGAQPVRPTVLYDGSDMVFRPTLIIFIEDFGIGSNCIRPFLWLWESVRWTMLF